MVADGNRRGYRHLLDQFWDDAKGHGLDLPTEDPISAPSFCNARPKITSDLLHHLIRELATTRFDESFGSSLRWHGRRVFAVDGTKVNLQRGSDLEADFGVPNCSYCPQLLLSVMLDVCARAPVDLRVSSFRFSEREHLRSMISSLEVGSILVMDRGYPSYEVLRELSESGIDFLVRVPSAHTFGAVNEFRKRGGRDALITLPKTCNTPAGWSAMKLRAVKLRSPVGEESFYLTSLPRAEFKLAQLRELYHMRWEAEEFFKLLKGSYVGQGQFRSKSPEGVLQEIHAIVLYLAIARVLMGKAAEASDTPYSTLSQKAAVLGLADYIARIFLTLNDRDLRRHVDSLMRRIVRHREPRRPGRSFPRVSHQPRHRWEPGGRRGG